MEPILSVRELTKTFSRPGQGKQTAVNGVSFDLRPGERLGIIGESGSGKTTVANLVTRLLDADGGRILLDGVGESLRGLSRREARQEAVRLMERCGLPGELARRYPHEVSGGQCQRAAIARALAMGPKVLICDEATSALDVTVQKEILDLLRGLEGDLAILFICHDISLVQQFCHRVLVMHRGEIVEQGTPDEVICRPQHVYTRHLIDSVL